MEYFKLMNRRIRKISASENLLIMSQLKELYIVLISSLWLNVANF